MKYLKKSDVADLLQLSERRIDYLLAEGSLPPAVIIGKSKRWIESELQEWIQQQRTETK
jgi:predicted DNA-binding transcriptional regulator AlpA